MPTVRDLLGRKRARGVPGAGDVVAASPDDTVLAAAQLMTQRGIGGLVVKRGDELAGIFTERDILRRVVGGQRDPATTRVADVMTSPVLTVRPDTKVVECRLLFTDRRIRHLPVLDADGSVCGVVTSGDVLAFEADEARTQIEHLRATCTTGGDPGDGGCRGAPTPGPRSPALPRQGRA
jgi:CBS domain-containing protein